MLQKTSSGQNLKTDTWMQWFKYTPTNCMFLLLLFVIVVFGGVGVKKEKEKTPQRYWHLSITEANNQAGSLSPSDLSWQEHHLIRVRQRQHPVANQKSWAPLCHGAENVNRKLPGLGAITPANNVLLTSIFHTRHLACKLTGQKVNRLSFTAMTGCQRRFYPNIQVI